MAEPEYLQMGKYPIFVSQNMNQGVLICIIESIWKILPVSSWMQSGPWLLRKVLRRVEAA